MHRHLLYPNSRASHLPTPQECDGHRRIPSSWPEVSLAGAAPLKHYDQPVDTSPSSKGRKGPPTARPFAGPENPNLNWSKPTLASIPLHNAQMRDKRVSKRNSRRYHMNSRFCTITELTSAMIMKILQPHAVRWCAASRAKRR